MKTRFLILALLSAISTLAGPQIAISEQSKRAWLLSGKGTKHVECYFWSTKTEVSTVACAALKNPTDEISVILPVDATDFYHTHPQHFPQLSDADKAAERKSRIRIHVIH